jgi:hypothetical protein
MKLRLRVRELRTSAQLGAELFNQLLQIVPRRRQVHPRKLPPLLPCCVGSSGICEGEQRRRDPKAERHGGS